MQQLEKSVGEKSPSLTVLSRGSKTLQWLQSTWAICDCNDVQ